MLDAPWLSTALEGIGSCAELGDARVQEMEKASAFSCLNVSPGKALCNRGGPVLLQQTHRRLCVLRTRIRSSQSKI